MLARYVGGGVVSPAALTLLTLTAVYAALITGLRRLSLVGYGYAHLTAGSPAFALLTGEKLPESKDRIKPSQLACILDMPAQNLPGPVSQRRRGHRLRRRFLSRTHVHLRREAVHCFPDRVVAGRPRDRAAPPGAGARDVEHRARSPHPAGTFPYRSASGVGSLVRAVGHLARTAEADTAHARRADGGWCHSRVPSDRRCPSAHREGQPGPTRGRQRLHLHCCSRGRRATPERGSERSRLAVRGTFPCRRTDNRDGGAAVRGAHSERQLAQHVEALGRHRLGHAAQRLATVWRAGATRSRSRERRIGASSR